MNDAVTVHAAGDAPAEPRFATATGGERVRQQQAALLEVMRSGLLSQDLPRALSRLAAITAATLSVARVSIWMFNQGQSRLELACLHDVEDPVRAKTAPQSLEAGRYPAYFEALRKSRVIPANDARRDPRTAEFAADYLGPLGIHSLLDATLWEGDQCRGVVCIEATGARRSWTPDEEQFAGSIADLVLLAMENARNRAAEARFTQVFSLSPDWMLVTRAADGVIIEVNASFLAGSGYGLHELIGRTTREVGLWASIAQREAILARTMADGQVRAAEADMRLKSGEVRTMQVSTERITVDGQPCFISISRDISEAKRQEHLVHEIEQAMALGGEAFFPAMVARLAAALDADTAFVGEIVPGNDTHITTIAAQTRAGPGKPFTYELAGSPCETVLGEGVCAYVRDVAEMFPADKGLADKGIQAYVGAPLLDAAGRPLGLIAAMFKRALDNSALAVQLLRIFAARAAAELERRRQLAELEFRAGHDQLTGLYNRASLERILDEAIRSGGHGCSALLLIDLDRFKEINDTLGHSVGDTLLVRIARRLQRENDTGTLSHGAVARLGGDEFAIWLPGITDEGVAEMVASRALAAITAPFEIEGYRLEVGASIGIGLFPAHGARPSDLLRCADIAMYLAKRQGRGYALYTPGEDPYSPTRLALLSELRGAIAAGQLELHYQPRVTLATGRPSGFEALVRWRHPTMGLLPPGQFVPLAELSDVIRPLTWWVLDEALSRLKSWSARAPGLAMAVNLSARHLMDDNCPEEVGKRLARHGVDPARLELEITESALIADPERASQTVRRIHDMGVQVSIDDFGTGFSSLSHLKRLPLNALKIDVSFVANMLSSEQDRVIVESTIGLAHNLGLTVVAEGIEDAATEARLKALRCDQAQGFFIAQPMPAAEAGAWLAARLNKAPA